MATRPEDLINFPQPEITSEDISNLNLDDLGNLLDDLIFGRINQQRERQDELRRRAEFKIQTRRGLDEEEQKRLNLDDFLRGSTEQQLLDIETGNIPQGVTEEELLIELQERGQADPNVGINPLEIAIGGGLGVRAGRAGFSFLGRRLTELGFDAGAPVVNAVSDVLQGRELDEELVRETLQQSLIQGAAGVALGGAIDLPGSISKAIDTQAAKDISNNLLFPGSVNIRVNTGTPEAQLNFQIGPGVVEFQKPPEIVTNIVQGQKQFPSSKADIDNILAGSDTTVPQDTIQKATKFKTGMNRSDQAFKEKSPSVTKKLGGFLTRKSFVDVPAIPKDQLIKAGPQGQRAVMRHTLALGASAEAKTVINESSAKIFKGLNDTTKRDFNHYLVSRGTVAVNARKPGIKTTDNITGEDAQAFIDTINSNPKLKADFEARAEEWNNVINNELDGLQKAGVITPQTATELKQFDYFKREFIDKMDPVVTGRDVGGNKIQVHESGIRKLEEGSTSALQTDAELILERIITANRGRIARNNINRELGKLVESDPTNGIVQFAEKLDGLTPEGQPRFQEPPEGFDELIFRNDGIEERLWMPEDLAKDWVLRAESDNGLLVKMLEYGSTRPVKFFATGANPEFVMSNLPRDIMFSWIANREFSSSLPIFIHQMSRDLTNTAFDALTGKGMYRQYVKAGGGMDFLSTQGRLAEKGALGQISKIMSFMGEVSERWVRLAVMRRAMRNGRTVEEAAFIARNQLDFAQGGETAKSLDKGILYFNASIQGARGFWRAAKDDPARFSWQMAQLGTMTTGLWLTGNLLYRDVMQDVPERQRISNWIVPLPWKVTDSEGNRRHTYIPIPKEQSLRVVTTVFEALMERAIYGTFPTKSVFQAMQESVPIIPGTSLPPLLESFLAVRSNLDFWRNEQIWRGQQNIPAEQKYWGDESQAFIDIGRKLGIPPKQLEAGSQKMMANNSFTNMALYGYDVMRSGMDEKSRQKNDTDILKIPFIRRAVKFTPVVSQSDFEKKKKLEEEDNGRKAEQKRIVRQLTQELLDGDEAKRQELKSYINSQPEPDQKRLVKQAKTMKEMQLVSPDQRAFMSTLKNTSSPEIRAFVFWEKFKDKDAQTKQEMKEALKIAPGVATDRFLKEVKKLKRQEK